MNALQQAKAQLAAVNIDQDPIGALDACLGVLNARDQPDITGAETGQSFTLKNGLVVPNTQENAKHLKALIKNHGFSGLRHILVGDKSAAQRQQLMSQIVGTNVPISKSGITTIEG